MPGAEQGPLRRGLAYHYTLAPAEQCCRNHISTTDHVQPPKWSALLGFLAHSSLLADQTFSDYYGRLIERRFKDISSNDGLLPSKDWLCTSQEEW